MKKTLFAILTAAVLTVSLACSVFAADEEEDYTVLGLLTEHGYVNEYFDYKLELPDDFTPESRAMISLLDEDVVEASNKENTLSTLMTMLKLSYATVFEADNGISFITISVQSPGLLNDYWDKEEVVAENTTESVEEQLSEMNDDGIVVANIETKVDYLDDFAGDKHYIILYKYTANDTPIYGVNILMRSEDGQYMNMINIETLDPDAVKTITGYFTEIEPEEK